jgi:hypothetical protein
VSPHGGGRGDDDPREVVHSLSSLYIVVVSCFRASGRMLCGLVRAVLLSRIPVGRLAGVFGVYCGAPLLFFLCAFSLL